MPQNKHKYRVSIYLGKELYEQFKEGAMLMGISVSTFAKIILNTGFELSKTLEKKVTNDLSSKD